MSPWFLPYDLQNGYVHNWLVAGPQIVSEKRSHGASMGQESALATLWDQAPDLSVAPMERAKFTLADPSSSTTAFTWDYRRVEADHLVDMAGSHPAGSIVRAWSYTEIVSAAARPVGVVLYSFGPAQLWVNGRLVAEQQGVSLRSPQGLPCDVDLAAGANAILVRFAISATDVCPLAIALRVLNAEDRAIRVRLPTLNRKVKKHQTIERWASRAYFERDLYAASQKLQVKWPGPIRGEHRLMVRVEKPSGYIVGHVERPLEPKVPFNLLEANSALDGSYIVRVYPEYDEYLTGMVFSRDMDVNLLHSAHVESSTDDYDQSGRVLLEHVLWWNEGLYSEIARMALAKAGLEGWKGLLPNAIRQAMAVAAEHGVDSANLQLGLLLIAYRYAPDESFPDALRGPLEEGILGYDYAADEPRDDACLAGDLGIVGYSCQVLAGRLYPDRTFARSGQAGEWHAQRGQEQALTWLVRRAYGGFTTGASDEACASVLPALLALADYSSSEALGEMAAVVVDKLLFTLAVNSFKGVLGSPRGATRAPFVTDGRMQPASPVSRLLWGMGSWNQYSSGAMGLVTSEQYGAPEIMRVIAADRAEEVWAREGHVVAWSGEGTRAEPDRKVNIATYKTPEAMLSSAQDYRPGEPGRAEHIWQATLGPDAIVFVNHPVCLSQKAAYQPNFWCGNGALPRVAQWKDLLIALYRLPDDDWLGYTHAHFPIAALDEHAFREDWAFGRKGDAYLAIKASRGLTLIKSGNSAYRELRSPGQENVWLCQVGRAAQDGAFAEFQDKVLAASPATTGLGVSGVSLRGDSLSFDWTGPFLVNGQTQPLDGFKHYDNPYCMCDYGAEAMEIQTAGWMLKLDLRVSEG